MRQIFIKTYRSFNTCHCRTSVINTVLNIYTEQRDVEVERKVCGGGGGGGRGGVRQTLDKFIIKTHAIERLL